LHRRVENSCAYEIKFFLWPIKLFVVADARNIDKVPFTYILKRCADPELAPESHLNSSHGARSLVECLASLERWTVEMETD